MSDYLACGSGLAYGREYGVVSFRSGLYEHFSGRKGVVRVMRLLSKNVIPTETSLSAVVLADDLNAGRINFDGVPNR